MIVVMNHRMLPALAPCLLPILKFNRATGGGWPRLRGGDGSRITSCDLCGRPCTAEPFASRGRDEFMLCLSCSLPDISPAKRRSSHVEHTAEMEAIA